MGKKGQVDRDRKRDREEEGRRDERRGGGGRDEGKERWVQLPTKVKTASRQVAVPCSLQMRRISPSVTVRESLVHMRRERVTRALVSQMPTRLLSQMSELHNGITSKQ